MTADRLVEIKARAAAATPGPWECELPRWNKQGRSYRAAVRCESRPDDPRNTAIATVFAPRDCGEKALLQPPANGVFIAAARSDVPDLVAALEVANARIAALDAEVEQLSTDRYELCREKESIGEDLESARAQLESIRARLADLIGTVPDV